MLKLEHQRKEEEMAKAKALDLNKPSTSKHKTSPVTPFRAINEPEPPGANRNPVTQEKQGAKNTSDTSIKGPSEDESVRLDSGSDSENLRSRDEDYDLDPDTDPEQDYDPREDRNPPSPEREVSFTTPSPPTNSSRRNFRRRRAFRTQRLQDNADKKRREINERLRSKREEAKQQKLEQRPKRSQTSSTDIMTDSDDRASTRNPRDPKNTRQSQESIEEPDFESRKSIFLNKQKHRRQ